MSHTLSATLSAPASRAMVTTSELDSNASIRKFADQKRGISEARRLQTHYNAVFRTNMEGVPDKLVHDFEEDRIIPAGANKFLYTASFPDHPKIEFRDKLEVMSLVNEVRKVAVPLKRTNDNRHPKVKFEIRLKNPEDSKREALDSLIEGLHISPSGFTPPSKTASLIVSSIETMDETLAYNLQEYMKAYVVPIRFNPLPKLLAECYIRPAFVRSGPQGFLGTVVLKMQLPNYRAGAGNKILKRILHPGDLVIYTTIPSVDECDVIAMSNPYGLTSFYFCVRLATAAMPSVTEAWSKYQVRCKMLAGRKWCSVEGPPRAYGARGERVVCLMHLVCDRCGLENELFGCFNFA